MDTATQTERFVARHQRKAFRKISEAKTVITQFVDETCGTQRVVACDIVTDGFEIVLCLVREDDDH